MTIMQGDGGWIGQGWKEEWGQGRDWMGMEGRMGIGQGLDGDGGNGDRDRVGKGNPWKGREEWGQGRDWIGMEERNGDSPKGRDWVEMEGERGMGIWQTCIREEWIGQGLDRERKNGDSDRVGIGQRWKGREEWGQGRDWMRDGREEWGQ